MKPNRLLLLAILAVATIVQPIHGQPRNALGGALHWRSIGPYRGGRVTAVSGAATQPFVYYMGATGGGVWENQGAGGTRAHIFHRFFRTRSVGAPSSPPSKPQNRFSGLGEACPCRD